LLIFYIIGPMLFGMPFGLFILLGPASSYTAIIAIWIMLAYSLLSIWAKVFVNEDTDNAKTNRINHKTVK